jgi:hypothetical protein
MTGIPRRSPAACFFPLLFPFLLLIAASGCNSVYSIKPMGKNPVPLSPKEWDGTWIAIFEGNNENIFKPVTVKVIDENQGLLRAAAIAADNVDFGLQTTTIHIRESNDTLFASRLANPASDRYVWGLIFKEGGKILLWVPAPKRFGELVKDGTLPGSVYSVGEGEDVLLGEMSEQHMERIVHHIQDLFLPNFPFVYSRFIDRIGPTALAVAPMEVEKPIIDVSELLQAEVRWVGTVANEPVEEVPAPGGPSGTQVIIDNPPGMAEATTKIPARKGERFGISYVLKGVPEGSHAGIREIWRFPEPGLTNPETGITTQELVRRKILVVTDNAMFSGWALLYEWELVPGTWTFELWTGDRLLLRQPFEVHRP